MEGGAQGGALSCAFSAEPMLGYQQEFGDQRGNRLRCDDLELAAEARDLRVGFPQFGSELFDRKLVHRHNGLVADSPHSEAKLAANLGRSGKGRA